MRFLMFLMFFAAITGACSTYQPPVPEASKQADNVPRENCDQILGTPFRSPDERQWFQDNCSKWPPTNYEEIIVKGQSQPDSAACAAMRGRPYRNDTDRQWFLSNSYG